MEAVLLGLVLMLSIFLGFELISKVPATLHTPLMSGANAISGITLVGALVSAGRCMGASPLCSACWRWCSPPSTWSAVTW
jgi:H+-translocating NAD(P) transhydrogenase subunit alpha